MRALSEGVARVDDKTCQAPQRYMLDGRRREAHSPNGQSEEALKALGLL
jgi:hypothetical protein